MADHSSANSPSSDVVFSIYGYDAHHAQWPILAKKILIGNREVLPNVPIHVEGQWLRGLKVVMQNVSPQHIVFAVMIVRFPETGDGKPGHAVFTAVSVLGRRPELARYRPDGSRISLPPAADAQPPIDVPPNGLITFGNNAFDDDDQAQAYKAAGGQITKVEIEFEVLYFGDNIRWAAETYFVPTSEPGQWARIPARAFLEKSRSIQ